MSVGRAPRDLVRSATVRLGLGPDLGATTATGSPSTADILDRMIGVVVGRIVRGERSFAAQLPKRD